MRFMSLYFFIENLIYVLSSSSTTPGSGTTTPGSITCFAIVSLITLLSVVIAIIQRFISVTTFIFIPVDYPKAPNVLALKLRDII